MAESFKNIDKEIETEIQSGQAKGLDNLNDNPDDQNLPNLDNAIDLELGNLPGGDPPAGGDNNASGAGDPPANTPPTGSILEKFSPIVDVFKSKIEGFELPADTTEENLFDRLIGGLATPIREKITAQLDQRALDYNQHLLSGGTPESFLGAPVSEVDYDKMSDDDILAATYKAKFGERFTDDQIAERVKGLDDFEKAERASSEREALKTKATAAKAAAEEANKAARLKSYETVKTQLETSATEAVNAIVDLNKKNQFDLFGLRVKDEEIQAFAPVFKALMIPDEKGDIPAMSILQDNNLLFKTLYLAQRDPAIIEKYISEQKRNEIAAIRKKLSTDPQNFGSSAGGGSSKAIDFDKLVAPEQQS